jgi:hypothetical protein
MPHTPKRNYNFFFLEKKLVIFGLFLQMCSHRRRCVFLYLVGIEIHPFFCFDFILYIIFFLWILDGLNFIFFLNYIFFRVFLFFFEV